MLPEHEIDIPKLREAAQEAGLRLVILFGSHAGGPLPPRPDSDVDLAVLPPPGSARTAFWELRRVLAPAFHRASLDLVVLDGSDPLLELEVMSRGVLLYGDPDDFAQQRLLAYRRFQDAGDLRRLEEQLFRKRMRYLREVLDGAA